jgi:hypothetical protein
MSSQTKIIKDIFSIYNTILENKEVEEAVDVYDNVDFKSIGRSNPSSDNISVALLQDVQTAAKNAGIKVDITTAISGHGKKTKSGNTSRHPSGNAVDIAIINGKAVSPSNRADADKLVGELVKMGYTKNAEGPSNPKSVLTFGFEGHDNHVHISNITSSPSDTSNTSGTSSGKTSSKGFARSIGAEILKSIGIQESFEPSSFGSNTKVVNGKVLIPRNSNSKIKSPVSGRIVDVISNSSCVNQITIEFEDGFLEYCGITSPSDKIKSGLKVGVGTVLGTTKSNTTVSLYTHNKRKDKIVFDSENEKNKKKEKKDGDLSDKGQYSQLLIKGYRELKKSFDKDKKVEENIQRIKGLL